MIGERTEDGGRTTKLDVQHGWKERFAQKLRKIIKISNFDRAPIKLGVPPDEWLMSPDEYFRLADES